MILKKRNTISTMKRLLLLSISLLIGLLSQGQNLSLADLTNLCSRKNWEEVNQSLIAKKWSFFDSRKGDTYNYNTIVWSYDKQYYSDEASAWLFLFTYDGMPNKITYSVYNKDSYNKIQNSLNTAGFKLSDTKIENQEIIATYTSNEYKLQISTVKRSDDDYYGEASFTEYKITVIKKAGVYDPDNGLKKEYYFDGVSVQYEYTVKNGKLNGPFNFYYFDGKPKKNGFYKEGLKDGEFKEYFNTGILSASYFMKNDLLEGTKKTYYENGTPEFIVNYSQGKRNGYFSEYDSLGYLKSQFEMLNDELNGTAKFFEYDRQTIESNYSNGKLDGTFKEYFYDASGKRSLEYSGSYSDGLKNGVWNLYLVSEYPFKIIESTSFQNDIKNGPFIENPGDSLIFGTYKNDKLNGQYSVYYDPIRAFFGGYINTDTTQLELITTGYYENNFKTGKWSYYTSGIKTSEGIYWKDKQDGEWNYFYPKIVSNASKYYDFTGDLYLTKTYENGILNGKVTRLSYLDEKLIPCAESVKSNVNPLDTCTVYHLVKSRETYFYKNDQLHGPYTNIDEKGELRIQGNYVLNKKEGEWLESYYYNPYEDSSKIAFESGLYINDLRQGKWTTNLEDKTKISESNYSLGQFSGEYIIFGSSDLPKEKYMFDMDNMESLSVFDSTGSIIKKYEVILETMDFIKVRRILYNRDNSISQEFYYDKDESNMNYFIFDFIFDFKLSNKDNLSDCYADGPIIFFDNKNRIILDGTLRHDQQIGIWTFYFYDQNVRLKDPHEDQTSMLETYSEIDTGKPFSGTFYILDEEKNIMEERKIKKGLRNGKTIFRDNQTGKIIDKEKFEDGKLKD